MSSQGSPVDLIPPKPHKRYSELVTLLEQRGMIIPDKDRAKRKLSQIGYYRLSGYWYPCRKGEVDARGEYVSDSRTGLPIRTEQFQQGTNFNDIISLYLFDKKLRLLMLDAIERIEINIRSVIAHEVGRFDPLAYQNESFIRPKILEDKTQADGTVVNHWKNWLERQEKLIKNSKEDCILHHKIYNIPIPFWVVVETFL